VSAVELIAEVVRLGGRLFVPAPGRVRVRSPQPLPEPLRARLRAAKLELLDALDRADMPPALVLRDGRRHGRIPSHRGGAATDTARALVAVAKEAGVVLVADNAVLSITAQADTPRATITNLAANAADVLAELHRASDARLLRTTGLDSLPR
jgi:glycine/D-amino acid oxidase-like deaminating enzyme